MIPANRTRVRIGVAKSLDFRMGATVAGAPGFQARMRPTDYNSTENGLHRPKSGSRLVHTHGPQTHL